MRRNWFLYVAVAVIIFVAGMAVGDYYDFDSHFAAAPLAQDYTEQDTHYQFISPLLFCQDQDLSGFTDAVTQSMQSQITGYITAQKNAGTLTDAAVYYKDLNNGPSLSINGSLQFAPASLLKIPTAIGVFKEAESNSSFLSTQVPFTGSATSSNASQYFAPPQEIQPGQSYTIEELLRYMLEDSDNAALTLLGSTTNPQTLMNTFSDLGVAAPNAPQPEYTIDVKTFASFFRVLYNASYLSQDDSEHMLSLLSQSTFSDGLVAGVPTGTVVAHKFGEYNGGSGQNELHDCGIVYKPHEPYLLCVMTVGTNYPALAGVISHISNIVYTTLNQQSN